MTASVGHVVAFVQENHTTDNYFRSMSAWGANVATDWPVQPNPPAKDQPHNRAAYAKWLHAQQAGTTSPATHTQFDTVAVLPYYAYLAATGPSWRTTARVSERTPPLTTCCSLVGRPPPCATLPAPRPHRCGTCPRSWATPATTG